METLTYPKRDITKADVMKQKREFSYPDWWLFSEDKTNYYLTFKPPETEPGSNKVIYDQTKLSEAMKRMRAK